MAKRASIFRFIPALVLCSAITPSCFAAIASCSTSTATSVADTRQAGGIAIAAAGPGNDFTTLNGTTPAGCAGTDISFINPAVSGNGSLAGGTYLSTLTNQTLAAGPVIALFSAVRGADNTGNQTNNDGINNWFDNAGGGSPTVVTTSFEVDSSLLVSSFSLNLLGVHLGTGGGSLTGSVNLCLGAAFGPANSCSGTIQSFSLSPGVFAYNLTLTSPVTTIGVANNFTLTGTGNLNAATYLTSFEETFSVPEPSTFLLLGAALAGIGIWRLRKA